MSSLPERHEVPKEHQWKLEDLFASQSAWDEEYAKVKEHIKELAQYQGKLSDAKMLKMCFALEDVISLHTERLYVYANMRHHENMADPKYQALSDKAKKLSVEVSEATSFITPEVLSLSEDTLDAFIADPQLAPYKQTLKEMKRQKPHVLSKTEEALLAQVGNIAQAPGTIFGMMNNADMKFPVIKNDKGEEVELTHGRYIQFMESRNREVRKNAFDAMYSTYAKYKNTLAATLERQCHEEHLFFARPQVSVSAGDVLEQRQHPERSVYESDRHDS